MAEPIDRENRLWEALRDAPCSSDVSPEEQFRAVLEMLRRAGCDDGVVERAVHLPDGALDAVLADVVRSQSMARAGA